MLVRLLAVLVGLLFAVPGAAQDLRVVTWNVLNGFGNGKALDAAAQWLTDADPDLVALQELTGFDDAKLAAAAERWGHAHSALSKVGGYPVGLTSKTPIEVVEKRTAGLHHGYLHARTAGLDVVVVHLHPGSWEFRLKEAAILAELTRELLETGRPVVMLGDFNAHAAIDRRRLATRGPLLERRAQGGGGNRRGDGFDHEAIETLLATGLVDVAVDRLGGTPEYEGTFPTHYLEHARTDASQHGFLERIDFVLLDPATARRCERMAIGRGVVCDAVSDHYPVTVDLRAEAVAGELPVDWTHQTESLRGFTIHVARKLRARNSELAAQALEELDHQLRRLVRVVPEAPLAKLREIPIWVNADSPTVCMAYHPSREWLASHDGFDPRMALGVEIGNPATFLAWTRHTQPWMVLHELAHGYHDRELGFDHEGIREAHARARADERYTRVLTIDGGRHQHYALTTPQEWFAETSEAWFGTNDFQPFVRGELLEFDPQGAALMRAIWGD